MKNSRHGQSAIISEEDYAKIRKRLRSKKYRLLFDIARYTGERWGAIVQLRLVDVFDEGGKVKDYITFRAATRKASPDGKRHTRQVPVHPSLAEIIGVYQPPNSGWLFESRICPGAHITLRAADLMFRGAVEAAGLSHKGFSTHSTRRTFITVLHQRGVDIHTIQQVTGHADLKSLVRYIESDPERVAKAIAVL